MALAIPLTGVLCFRIIKRYVRDDAYQKIVKTSAKSESNA